MIMSKQKYYILYILFLFLYVFTLILLPNDLYLNIIFSSLWIIITFLLIYFKKVSYKIIFIINIFFIYISFYNNINIPYYFTININEISKFTQLDISDSEDENIKEIKNILNSKLDSSSIYNIYWIVKRNEDLDYSNLDFDVNNIFTKLVEDTLFNADKENSVLGITLFYTNVWFKNYKTYFKNYLIKKYVYNEDLNGDIFTSNNSILKTLLNKKYLYNLHINEKIYEINYRRLNEIKEMIK